MTRREVKIPLASYRDPDGLMRYALQGEGVDVDPDHIEEFDKLNGPPQVQATKQRGRPRKKG